MNTTHSPRPPARATRFVLATIVSGAVAAVLLAGCGSASEGPARPAAARGVSDPGSVVTDPAGGAEVSEGSVSAGATSPVAPAGSPGSVHTPAVAPASAGTSPSATPAADIDQSLAGLDRDLADLDHQLTDADHDVATPEGDIR